MRLLIPFLFSIAVSQLAYAKGQLTRTTRHLLKSGEIFKLELRPSGKTYTGSGTQIRLSALSEINSSPSLTEEALGIVATEHGEDTLKRLKRLLKFEDTAASLGVELNLNTAPVVQVVMGE